MNKKKTITLNSDNINAMNDLFETLNHYPNHTVIAALIASTRTLLFLLDKKMILQHPDQSLKNLLHNINFDEIDEQTVSRLVSFFANGALDHYEHNKSTIDKDLKTIIH